MYNLNRKEGGDMNIQRETHTHIALKNSQV